MSITIAVVAQGMMGSGVGSACMSAAPRCAPCCRGAARRAPSAPRAAGMKPAADERALLDGADFFLSILPPGEAEALAGSWRRRSPALDSKPVYVDCNAISPQTADAHRRDHRADRRRFRRWRDHRRPAARRATARRSTPRGRRPAKPRCCAIGASTGASSTDRSAPPRRSRCPMPGSPRASRRSPRRCCSAPRASAAPRR